MAKKKMDTLGLILLAAAVVLGLVAVFMMFGEAVHCTAKVGGAEDGFTGVETAFGYSEETMLGTAQILKANWLAALGFLLPILAIAAAVASLWIKPAAFVSAALFVVSAILIFLSITAFPGTVIGSEYGSAFNYSLGACAIVSGICSILAACSVGVKLFLRK